MGLFAAVAEKRKSAPTKSRPTKNTTWMAGDPRGDEVAKSVHELKDLKAQIKSIEAKMGVHKTVVQKFANDHFVRDFAELGVPPETPMVVQNADGEKVTFVVQDRTGQYGLKDDKIDNLKELLGEDAVERILHVETSFGFNRDVLQHPGVMEVVEKALEKATKELVSKNVLSQEQVEALLDVDQKTTLRPGTYDRMGEICGRDTVKMQDFLDIVGSSICRFVLP